MRCSCLLLVAAEAVSLAPNQSGLFWRPGLWLARVEGAIMRTSTDLTVIATTWIDRGGVEGQQGGMGQRVQMRHRPLPLGPALPLAPGQRTAPH